MIIVGAIFSHKLTEVNKSLQNHCRTVEKIKIGAVFVDFVDFCYFLLPTFPVVEEVEVVEVVVVVVEVVIEEVWHYHDDGVHGELSWMQCA